jgi:predicted dehydrogenase
MGSKIIRWGFLNTSKIAREKLLPAIQKAGNAEIVAIGSSQLQKAEALAIQFKIPRYYGSYEEVLLDEDVDAVYISLPNHLHIEWTIRALRAGKHVLCEKPIALSEKEARIMEETAALYPNLKVMEAFMYRYHPQWEYAKAMVDSGELGTVKIIQSFFSYNNQDPDNIRNKIDLGGGGLMDIGCYCVSLSRHIFDAEPHAVVADMQRHPVLKTDVVTSGILSFDKGTSIFTCSTQLMPYQRVNILGDKGRLEIEIPFNTLPDQQSRIYIYRLDGVEEVCFEPVDQYTLQFEKFSEAVIGQMALAHPIREAVANMKIIDLLVASAKQKTWQTI